MKIVSYLRGDETRVGLVDGDRVVDAGTSLFDLVPGTAELPLSDVRLLAPVPRPGKIICVGLNYRDHAEEAAMAIPDRPVLFAKFANAVVGPGSPIRIPRITRQVDYEAELGVVIGRVTKGVGEDKALDHVAGYTCLNDVSARDLQLAVSQWLGGKTLDTFCPMGPWVVTADEIPDPQALSIRASVNGVVRQDASTADMIFSVAELVAFVSRGITLEPGDVIATGTPPGVGFARTPPVFLQPGDRVAVEIGAIGTLSNPVEEDD